MIELRSPEIADIKDLGPQFVNNDLEMVGQDGAFSIPLEDGRLMVFFGDTIFGKRRANESLWYPNGKPVGPWDMTGKAGVRRMINNCGMIIQSRDRSQLLSNFSYIMDNGDEVKNLLPHLSDEDPDDVRIWCLHGIEHKGVLSLFYVKVRMLEKGPFPVNFDVLGSGLAQGDSKTWSFHRTGGPENGLFWSAETARFGSAVLIVPDDPHVYVYGVRQNPATHLQEGSVARVAPGELANLKAYEYYAGGSNWSADVQNAAVIFSDFPNELSVSYNSYLNSYIAVHSFIMTGKVLLRQAPTPWGPWSAGIELFEAHHPRTRQLPYPPLLYAGKEHPWLSTDGGQTIYVTYIEFEEYFPHLMQISFK